MSKFNRPGLRPQVHSPVASTSSTPDATTHEGGAGYSRDAKSELFLLAVTNMVSENTFYEGASERDARFNTLVHTVAHQDLDWLSRFIPWLRSEANMRSASVVAAAEVAAVTTDDNWKGKLIDGRGPVRVIVDRACQRADEPGEMLAYWLKNHGRRIPFTLRKGLADAVRRLYTEYTLLKYDTPSHAVRFADVIDLVHPTPVDDRQDALFKFALERRHNRDNPVDMKLTMIRANQHLRSQASRGITDRLLNPEDLKLAGMTWEDVLSLVGSKVDKRRLWEALAPTMGYMALLRNLRNMDEAGVSDELAARVAARLSDPEEVTKSRQLPMRFLSAYRAAPSLRWSYPLERALQLSLANVPTLTGRTLIMVDTSGSMNSGFSKDGTLMRWDAAALFGLALASRCATADVVSFSDGYWGGAGSRVFHHSPAESVLRGLERWRSEGYFIGGGTATAQALRTHFNGHTRVVVLTDEQAFRDAVGVDRSVPSNVPMYTWNLAGYAVGHTPSGADNRHTFGGLTDQAFKMIPLLEAHQDATWPF